MVSRAVRPADATVEGGRQKGNLLATGSVVSIFTVAKHLGISATGEDGARDVNPRLSKAPLKSFPPPSARQAPASLPAGTGEALPSRKEHAGRRPEHSFAPGLADRTPGASWKAESGALSGCEEAEREPGAGQGSDREAF